jgi:uncharacterized RDD family membrane protein YckC
MENLNFTISTDLLASPVQRFFNLIIDLLIIYAILLGIETTIKIISDVTNSRFLSEGIENLDVVDQCVIGIIIAILYYSLTEIYFSRSLAKYFTKTVVTMKDGSKPDNKTIFMRTFCRLIPIDFLTFLKIPARGWHDTISGTYVVKKHPFVEKKGWF